MLPAMGATVFVATTVAFATVSGKTVALATLTVLVATTATSCLAGDDAGEFGKRRIQGANLCRRTRTSIQKIVITGRNGRHTTLLLEVRAIQGHRRAGTTMLFAMAASVFVATAMGFTVGFAVALAMGLTTMIGHFY
jgi:hypothetical protein